MNPTDQYAKVTPKKIPDSTQVCSKDLGNVLSLKGPRRMPAEGPWPTMARDYYETNLGN